MSTIIDFRIYLTQEELEALTFKYKNEEGIKLALTKLIDNRISRQVEQIILSDDWYFKDSKYEEDEGESK